MIEIEKCVQKKKIRANILVNFVIEVHNNSINLLGRETVKNYSVNLVHKELPPPFHKLPPKRSWKKLNTVIFLCSSQKRLRCITYIMLKGFISS